MPLLITIIVILIIVALIAASGIKIVPQARAYVIVRLGAYHETL